MLMDLKCLTFKHLEKCIRKLIAKLMCQIEFPFEFQKNATFSRIKRVVIEISI